MAQTINACLQYREQERKHGQVEFIFKVNDHVLN